MFTEKYYGTGYLFYGICSSLATDEAVLRSIMFIGFFGELYRYANENFKRFGYHIINT